MLQLDEYTYNEHHHTSPSSASNTTSLAATLTPGTPTAIEDDSLKRLSLNSVNLTSLSRSSATLPGPPSSSATSESCNSDSSLLSSVGMTPDDEDEDEEGDYQYEDDLDDDDDGIYGSEVRHQRAKEAAKILLSQCLLEDNPRYYSDSFSKTSRLGLAPITLLLNPETPCPTKIIPLPDSTTSNSSSSSSYSLSDDCPSSEEEQEAYDVQEAQAASLFIRLL